MHSTRLIAGPGQSDDRAVGYRWNNGTHERAPTTPLHPLVEMSTGGLASTVRDLAQFDGALANGSLLPKEVLAAMWKPAGIGSAMYGMGFAFRSVAGRPQVGHTGGGPGATTSFARFQDDGITVILLTNTAQPTFSVQEIIGENHLSRKQAGRRDMPSAH
jgi:CubicO group peptidase (beta-lactamase class C family)